MISGILIVNRVGIEIPKIEVRFEHLDVEGDVYVGSRALPTLLNVTINTIEVFFFLKFNLIYENYETLEIYDKETFWI